MIKVISLQNPKEVAYYSESIGLIDAIVSHEIYTRKETGNLLNEQTRNKYKQSINLGKSTITKKEYAYNDRYYSKFE